MTKKIKILLSKEGKYISTSPFRMHPASVKPTTPAVVVSIVNRFRAGPGLDTYPAHSTML